MIGRISPAARREAGYRWLNSLPAGQALHCLAGAGLPADLAAAVTGARPLPGQWLDQLRAGRAGLASGRPRAADLEALAAMLEGPAAERA